MRTPLRPFRLALASHHNLLLLNPRRREAPPGGFDGGEGTVFEITP
jgi:hypothetical protein